MTPTVVAAFADRESARRAYDRLVAAGTPERDITRHVETPEADNAAAVETDEYVTGGIVASFGQLLDGLMATSPADGNAATYRDLVRREGSLLSVRVADVNAADSVRQVLESCGATRVASLPQRGLED